MAEDLLGVGKALRALSNHLSPWVRGLLEPAVTEAGERLADQRQERIDAMTPPLRTSDVKDCCHEWTSPV